MDTPKRKEQKRLAQARYRETEKGRASDQRYKKSEAFRRIKIEHQKRWREKNKVKHAAHGLVGRALKAGILEKLSCEMCGNNESVAHHDDYNKPLDVRWLCYDHHNQVHCIQASKKALGKV